jgi:hypothetical protein
MKFLKSKKVPKGINEVLQIKLAQGIRKVPQGGPKCPGKKGNFLGEQCTFPKGGSKCPRNNPILNCFVITTILY